MIGDFEAYSRSCDPEGNPLRPEIYKAEYSDDTKFYNFAFNYDLPGEEQAIHFPFNKIHGIPDDQLKVFLRTDRIAHPDDAPGRGRPRVVVTPIRAVLQPQAAGLGDIAPVLLRVGSEIAVLHHRGRGVVLSTGDTRVALGGGIVEKLMVEPLGSNGANADQRGLNH